MTEEEKLLKMFKKVHGDATGACYLKVHIHEPYECDDETCVIVMKHGNECWRANKTDLLFDYVTFNWGKKGGTGTVN